MNTRFVDFLYRSIVEFNAAFHLLAKSDITSSRNTRPVILLVKDLTIEIPEGFSEISAHAYATG
jgi:hypothetical protein